MPLILRHKLNILRFRVQFLQSRYSAMLPNYFENMLGPKNCKKVIASNSRWAKVLKYSRGVERCWRLGGPVTKGHCGWRPAIKFLKFDCSRSSKIAVSEQRNTCYYNPSVSFQMLHLNFTTFSKNSAIGGRGKEIRPPYTPPPAFYAPDGNKVV